MKYISIWFLLFTICSCINQEKVSINVPWYVNSRIYNDSVQSYNYIDSLEKYNKHAIENVINKSNYLCYLANLNFVVHPKESSTTFNYIKDAFNANKSGFCENLINPSIQFLTYKNRPDRSQIMPFILNYNLQYFLSLRQLCMSCCSDMMDSITINLSDLDLQLSFISLMDQRFRNPQRQSHEMQQMKFDSMNRIMLDQLLVAYNIPNDNPSFREIIYLVILHSNDCSWTNKWLRRYMNSYSGYDNYEEHLKQFLSQSSCKSEYFTRLIEHELTMNIKK